MYFSPFEIAGPASFCAFASVFNDLAAINAMLHTVDEHTVFWQSVNSKSLTKAAKNTKETLC
jgi:hypothetical protein